MTLTLIDLEDVSIVLQEVKLVMLVLFLIVKLSLCMYLFTVKLDTLQNKTTIETFLLVL